MMIDLEELEEIYSNREQEILEEYKTFLRFKSISADPSLKKECEACAGWLAGYLQEIGMASELWETEGNPAIFASTQAFDPGKPTLLFYHHYDVQPADPLELWETPPFEPTVKGEEMFARGAQDNKGQCLYTLFALKILFEKKLSLPLNLKILIEGEEESGSRGLAALLPEKKKALKADWLVVVDTGMSDPETPAVTLGARGIATFDLIVRGTKSDLHSGTHGGLAYNPLHALVEILSLLRDRETGRVLVPGFYDAVKELGEEERQLLCWDFDEAAYIEEFGAEPTGGEVGYPPLERSRARPTLEINGISGGYSGPGFKTVIPREASAKISCRLVPDQSPEEISALVKNHLESLAPKGIEVEAIPHEGTGAPVRVAPGSIPARAFASAYERIFGKPAVFILEGGSIPITSLLKEASGAETLFIGLWLPSDLIHAPNERFGLDRLKKGFFSILLGIAEISLILSSERTMIDLISKKE